jgi:hypothetical protein
MPTYTPKTFTLVMPDQTDRFGGPPGPGNPPDGYVLTWDGLDGYYIARPSTRIQIISSPSVTPYTAGTQSEDIVEVQNHAGIFTVNLPLSPLTGTNYFIKDFAGVAGTNAINVASAQQIDGLNPYVINNNFGCIRVTFNGATWSVISKM